jgi:hypothetical protein
VIQHEEGTASVEKAAIATSIFPAQPTMPPSPPLEKHSRSPNNATITTS